MKPGELSIRSAARIIGVHRKTIAAWIARGEFIREFTPYPTGRIGIPAREVARIRDEYASRCVSPIGPNGPKPFGDDAAGIA